MFQAEVAHHLVVRYVDSLVCAFRLVTNLINFDVELNSLFYRLRSHCKGSENQNTPVRVHLDLTSPFELHSCFTKPTIGEDAGFASLACPADYVRLPLEQLLRDLIFWFES